MVGLQHQQAVQPRQHIGQPFAVHRLTQLCGEQGQFSAPRFDLQPQLLRLLGPQRRGHSLQRAGRAVVVPGGEKLFRLLVGLFGRRLLPPVLGPQLVNELAGPGGVLAHAGMLVLGDRSEQLDLPRRSGKPLAPRRPCERRRPRTRTVRRRPRQRSCRRRRRSFPPPRRSRRSESTPPAGERRTWRRTSAAPGSARRTPGKAIPWRGHFPSRGPWKALALERLSFVFRIGLLRRTVLALDQQDVDDQPLWLIGRRRGALARHGNEHIDRASGAPGRPTPRRSRRATRLRRPSAAWPPASGGDSSPTT